MKIAINTRFLLPDRLEGFGRVTYELTRRMVLEHPEDEFLFIFDRPFDEAYIFADNVRPIVAFPPARHPLLWYLWFEWSLPRILQKENPDVFWSPDGYCSLCSRVPTVMTTHDLAYIHYPAQVPKLVLKFYEHFVPKYLRHARRIATVSDFVKKDIQQQYRIAEEKIAVIPNAARPVFRPLSAKEQQAVRDQYADGQAYFFYFGTIQPRKNIERLIKAFGRFKKQSGAPTKLLLGGRWAWQSGPIRVFYEQADYKEDIRVLGYVEEDQIAQLLGGALGFVYVSLSEGFGLPVLEAFESEVPVITSDCSSLPEVAGDAALLVDPEDTDAIAAAMIRIYEEPDTRAQLVAAGTGQRQLFNWDLSARRMYELIKETATMR